MTTAAHIIERLGLQRHPEGGWFREVWRASASVDHPDIPAGKDARRCAGSLIYYLLEAGDFSEFHRVRHTDEIWHLYAGGPVELNMISASGDLDRALIHNLPDVAGPICIVPAGTWQAARIADDSPWALCGCTVSPGFEMADFEMPGRERLTAMFPQHAGVITELTHHRNP